MTITDTTTPAEPAVDFVQEWQHWHDGIEAQRRTPHSFLAYTSFNLWSEEPQRFDDVPGTWTPDRCSMSTASRCAGCTSGA